MSTPKHAGRVEMWIEARAYLNRHGASKPRHGMAHGHPANVCTRKRATIRARIRRALSGRPATGAHGIRYARPYAIAA